MQTGLKNKPMMKIKGQEENKVWNLMECFPFPQKVSESGSPALGSRRSRNRGRGQLLVKNSKPSTLQFESDFDFETANAEFNKNEIVKEASGERTMYTGSKPQHLP
jgi:hypothetical protein